MPRIIVQIDGEASRSFALRPGLTRIGRGVDADILVPHRSVSKVHGTLWCTSPTRLEYEEQAPCKNGTTLNGAPVVGKVGISPGDELLLAGVARVRFEGNTERFDPSVEVDSLELPRGLNDLMAVVGRLRVASEANQWALQRLPSLLGAPTRDGRYQYIVAECERVVSDPDATVWILSWDDTTGTANPTFDALIGGSGDVPSPVSFSSSIVGRTMSQGHPLWLDNARAEACSASVLDLRLRSVGCVPIGSSAALYLSNGSSRAAFEPTVRRRIEALCELAAHLERPTPEAPDADANPQLLPGLIGRSPAMQDVVAKVHSFARFSWNVLVLGEPGTGKTAVARALHQLSDGDKPLIHVNCATLTDSIATAELFGSARGAYADARDRPGYVGAAEGGTLFLDEVAELSTELQAKLLQLTREGTYTRVGEEERPRTFSGRIVAATNKPLSAMRPDLAERLRECEIRMPPLRDRREDVPLLAEWFLQQLCTEQAKAIGGRDLRFSGAALDRLEADSLEGNVARLSSRVKNAFIQAAIEGSDQVDVRHLGEIGSEPVPTTATTFEESVLTYKRQLLSSALERNGGNKRRTAEYLGMNNRQQLFRQLKKVGLQEDVVDE